VMKYKVLSLLLVLAPQCLSPGALPDITIGDARTYVRTHTHAHPHKDTHTHTLTNTHTYC